MLDELIRFFQTQGGQGDSLNSVEVIAAMTLCLICVVIICMVYRFTHKNASYSQSYVQTLVLTALVTTLIMIVIGSNIARAFSLVGALSIIRFRNAVKETRDVGYIFFAMAVAMACGTRFYFVGLLATLIISSVLIVMFLIEFGSSSTPPERFLTVQLPPDANVDETLGSTMDKLFDGFSVVSLETVRQGLYLEVMYSVRPKADIAGEEVIKQISAVNNNLKINYNYSSQLDEM